jgi:excisionase family DNA binding protein
MESEDLLLTENQAAKRLNISGKTLSKIRKRGEIAFLQIGRAIRYDVQSLLEWIMRSRMLSAT